LEEFKYMLGTWKVVSTCYGGLIDVKVCHSVIDYILTTVAVCLSLCTVCTVHLWPK